MKPFVLSDACGKPTCGVIVLATAIVRLVPNAVVPSAWNETASFVVVPPAGNLLDGIDASVALEPTGAAN
ncbi:hypothetical protein NL533_31385, partial [Klebsiella pneumoniae]|nr:hypothetical protein [Klebsiella pneumoniae]